MESVLDLGRAVIPVVVIETPTTRCRSRGRWWTGA
jgi:hypothetical protein